MKTDYVKTKPTLEAEAKGILAALLYGAKRWARAVGYTEPLPERSTEEDPGCFDID